MPAITHDMYGTGQTHWKKYSMIRVAITCFALCAMTLRVSAEDEATMEGYSVVSPNGEVEVVVSDIDGLSFSINWSGNPLLIRSELGLAFTNGVIVGPDARILSMEKADIDTSGDSLMGNRKTVTDRCTEARFTLSQPDDRRFGLLVRAYDRGVAFRYSIPKASGMQDFVLTDERTEFRFDGDFKCWSGSPSACAESFYHESRLGELKPGEQRVLPLLVKTPAAWVAVAESDVLDWPGMFLQGDGQGGARVLLPDRVDGNGKVASTVPQISPWRVFMIGERLADLVGNDLVATLATPSRIKDVSWIKPGACAWDPWWTGANPDDPEHKTGVHARGTTKADRQYIDFAAEMRWPYQLIDWNWYENMTSWNKALHSPPNANPGDFTKVLPIIDLKELVRYAKSKKVGLFIWAHSLDIKTFGMERALEYFAEQGFSGVKIDFVNNQSQETVQWCQQLLETAARYKLMVDLHGMYHPTGLSRTWPNLVTQEGVYGNEYNKMNRDVTPAHQLELVFTRGLLGPMDYTPGGFLNRWPDEFKPAFPAQVQGSRARELALAVLYLSPLTVFCDNPDNYRGQPGLDFYRDFPTTWDETVVLSVEMGGHAAIARRKNGIWRIAAINQDKPVELRLPLAFLGDGSWKLHAYTDNMQKNAPATVVEEIEKRVDAGDTLKVELAAAGGYAAIVQP